MAHRRSHVAWLRGQQASQGQGGRGCAANYVEHSWAPRLVDRRGSCGHLDVSGLAVGTRARA
eukprot:8123381-Alexandrium_andersonii.AAC.1